MEIMGRVVIRLLQLLSGLILFYGLEGMVTSEGLRGPNLIAWLGAVAVILCAAIAWRMEKRPLAGLWVSGAAVALPMLLQAASRLSAQPCPPNHPPLTESYYCVAPGAELIVAISAVVLVLALGGAIAELRGFRLSQPRRQQPV